MKIPIRKHTIYFGIAGALIAFWSAFYLYPQYIALHTFDEKIQSLVWEVEAASAEIEQIDRLKKEVQQAELAIQNLERRLLDRAKIPDILRDITRLGVQYNLRFTALHPNYNELLQSTAPDESPLLILPVALQVDGDFQNLGSFLSVLNKQHFFLAVDCVDLILDEDSYPLLRATIKGKLLLKRESTGVKTG